MSEMSKIISTSPLKYSNLGNPIVTIEINGVLLPKTLVDLEEAINTMNFETMTYLQLQGIKPTPIIFVLENKSIIKTMGTLEVIVITIASSQYSISFIVISPKNPGHLVVLGFPWLVIFDAMIGF